MPEPQQREKEIRKLLINTAKRFLLLPYKWGGDDPMGGFDCSGFIIELLKSIGVLKGAEDFSADALLDFFGYPNHPPAQAKAGNIIFWLNSQGCAIHVDLLLSDRFLIGAIGGGSSTTDHEAAELQNAFIKIRPLSYRAQSYVIIDPLKKLNLSD